MLTDDEYAELERALFSSAVGDDSLKPMSAVHQTEGTDSNGDKTTTRQVMESSKPNPALIARLLEDRIGGPQDYC